MFGGSCLGYGVVEPSEGRLILRNVLDIGDFLRREKK
jgi:ribosome biogenesis protein Nip4